METALLSMPFSCHAVAAIVKNEKREPSGREVWKEVCKDKIPPDRYRVTQICNQGPDRIITLLGSKYRAELIFHNVIAMRMLEKDVVPQGLFSENEMKKFRKDQFRNVIYQMDEGELDRFLAEGVRGKGGAMYKKHYLIFCADDMVEILAGEEVDVVVK